MAHTKRDDPTFGPKDTYGGSSERYSARQEIEEELDYLWGTESVDEMLSMGMFEKEQDPTSEIPYTHQGGRETSPDSSTFWLPEES